MRRRSAECRGECLALRQLETLVGLWPRQEASPTLEPPRLTVQYCIYIYISIYLWGPMGSQGPYLWGPMGLLFGLRREFPATISGFFRNFFFLFGPGQPGEAVRTGVNLKINKMRNLFRPQNRHVYVGSNSALFDHRNPSK